ncbi:hypothetical protein J437_LFUL010419 [Ladona fulva]|uniref:Tethering factor for nuclear proteasome STS1 n=1 Tax=Ladona fulva TaxID=123851 RepID=A0A8K0NUN5_LADFU|nr:hypothetical protein J437_LFUL010419 [Ladona fulva]
MNTPPHNQTTGVIGRRSTRSALSEIPSITWFSSIENGRFPGIDTRDNIQDVAGNNIPNLPASYMSPSPSPDEMIIQQRGRRRVPVTWSPDETDRKLDIGGKERTPVKHGSPACKVGVGGIVLRSTPRKRLLLVDPKELFPTPEKNKKGSPTPKKNRQEKAFSNFTGPLQAALKGLSQDQLIEVINTLAKKHPNLEGLKCVYAQEIKESLPTPDIEPLEEKLNYLKKNIFKSLPTSRLTSKTDSPAYSRAATHVLAFKKCVIEQGRQLVESQHWGSVLDYVFLAWSYVRATPLWDNPPHNAARRQCFKSLAMQCMTALKRGTWSPEACDEIEEKLEGCVADCEDMQMCMKQLSSIRKNILNYHVIFKIYMYEEIWVSQQSVDTVFCVKTSCCQPQLDQCKALKLNDHIIELKGYNGHE